MLICFVYWLVRVPKPALDAAFQRGMWVFFFLWRDVLPEKSLLCSAASLSKSRTGFFCFAIPPFLWDEEQFLPGKFGSVWFPWCLKSRTGEDTAKQLLGMAAFVVPHPIP